MIASRLITATLIFAVCLLSFAEAEAAKVQVWHHANPAAFSRAQLKNVVISNRGELHLSRAFQEFANLKALHVWALAEDLEGNLYVATGDEGKIFRVNSQGKVTVAFTSTDSQVLCLTTGPDGNVYAGTGPNGQVIRIGPKGEAKVLAQGVGRYVWSLVVDGTSKSLFAGTGPHGRIYEVSPMGKTSLYYATKQDHVLSLAQGPEGMLYAGTDKGGVIYRINREGRGFVVFSAHQSEVRSLVVNENGIYAGTSAPAKGKGGSGSRSQVEMLLSSLRDSSTIVPASTLGATRGKILKAVEISSKAGKGGSERGEEESGGEPASSIPPPGAGENSVYRIARDGTVRELYREKTMILALTSRRNKLLIGTGLRGQLVQVNEQTKERLELARLETGQVQCMLPRRDGSLVVGTGDPGKIYILAPGYSQMGTVVSEVLDAKMISQWGAASWQAKMAPGTSMRVSFRSGNVALPDETWSEWSTEQKNPSGEAIPSPPARFLQYRITLRTESQRQSPEVQSVTLRYMTTNHSPEISELDVPNLDEKNLENPGKIKIRWKATDPNEDELIYAIYARKEGWKNWVCLDDHLAKKEFIWDSTRMPSGRYQIKVVANDSPDNPTDKVLKGEKISHAFPVSQESPRVELRCVAVEKGRAILEAKSSHPHLRLTAGSYALNGKDWKNVFPTDGLFDTREENFRFRTENLRPGTYVLLLRITDAGANRGTADVVFTVPEK